MRKLWVPGVETYMPFRTLLVVAVAARSAVRTDEIDGAICAWANERSAEEAMMSLQAARLDVGRGAPPGRSAWRSASADAWLLAERRTELYEHTPQPPPAIREGERPYPVRHPARTFGESNAHAQEMLGRDSRA